MGSEMCIRDRAGINASEPACVFASGMGDTDITDYMCRALAGPEKMVSPTRFHNSVHNAPAGYWTISTQCEQAATSVAGFTHSFSIALLEALVQIETNGRAVLVVVNDIASPAPMIDINPIEQAFAAALLLQPPVDAPQSLMQLSGAIGSSSNAVEWPALDPQVLQGLYENNPAARSLALLQTLASQNTGDSRALHYPLSDACVLDLKVTPGLSQPDVNP